MAKLGLPKKIGDIQVLRGAAILLVLLEHTPLTGAVVGRFPHPVAFPGWLGVDLFFVVSGYVIARSLARDRFEPLSFIVRRAFRLTPALLLLVALVGGLTFALSEFDGSALDRAECLPEPSEFWAVGASVLGGFFTLRPIPRGCLLGVAWSLSVEDQFYIVLAGLSLAVSVSFRRLAPQILPKLLLALSAVLYLSLTWMRLEFLFRGYTPAAAWPLAFYLFSFRFDLLALGMLLGFVGPRYRDRLASHFEDRGIFWTPILFATPLALSAVCGSALRLTHGLVLPVAGWCFGLLVLAASHERAFPARRGWCYRAWTYLGNRSYAIYLFHTPAIVAASVLLGLPLGSMVFRTSVGFCAAHAVLVAIILIPLVEVVFRVVERPLTKMGRQLAERLRIVPTDEVLAAVEATDMAPARLAA